MNRWTGLIFNRQLQGYSEKLEAYLDVFVMRLETIYMSRRTPILILTPMVLTFILWFLLSYQTADQTSFSVELNKPIVEFNNFKDSVYSAAWSPDGQKLAATSESGVTHIWETDGWKLLAILDKQSRRIANDVSWSPDGNKLAVSNYDGTIAIWNTDTWERLTTLSAAKNDGYTVGWSQDSNSIASSIFDDTIRILDVSNNATAVISRNHEFRQVVWHPYESYIALANTNNTVEIWDAIKSEALMYLDGHKGKITAISWSPDGTQLATGSADHTIKIWDVSSGDNVTTLDETDIILQLAWNPDGKSLVSLSGGNVIHIWDVRTGELLLSLPTEGVIQDGSLMWSPGGDQIAFYYGLQDESLSKWNGIAWIIDANDGNILNRVEQSAPLTSIAFSPDGTMFETSAADGFVRVWRTIPIS